MNRREFLKTSLTATAAVRHCCPLCQNILGS